jgi:hypothetical protein
LSELFDPIRKLTLIKKPEEVIRQNLILEMIKLGFPKNLMCIEKELSQLPHLQGKSFSSYKRRLDIICFAKKIHSKHELYPLLMIECKAFKVTPKTIEQVLGYNHYVQAYFVSVATLDKIQTFWYNPKKEKYDCVDFLPTFKELVTSVKKNAT